MNILVSTLGMSWQIIPELFGFTNPAVEPFFGSLLEIEQQRKEHGIEPVDEVWAITTQGQQDLDRLQTWAEHRRCKLRMFVCSGITEFNSQNDADKMRSLIYRVVLKAAEITKQNNGKLFLSLSGGRKTMSADMQEAGTLFGCAAMIHIVDKHGLPPEMKDDKLLDEAKYQNDFMPVITGTNYPPHFIVAGSDTPLNSKNYPLGYIDNGRYFQQVNCSEDETLAKEIQRRKKDSEQLYSNFYNSLKSGNSGRDIFRKLYFLHPNILRRLKETPLTPNWIQRLPKADLHSHLGGVLSPAEIIETAVAVEKNESLNENIRSILEYRNKPEKFAKVIYSGNVVGIGIDSYQKLGDYQGSGLLQTKTAIEKCIEIYARKLKADNVHYVEVRCSPYKYTREGLTLDDVAETITDAFDKYYVDETHVYRLIVIVGRQSGLSDIKDSITQIVDLLKTNKKFADKLVGIDLAGNESAAKPEQLRELFMPFLEQCIRITIHAGETESVESIWQAVYHLSADRIGHGLKLLDRPELLKRFIDKNIGVEMCPSSNDQIVGYRNGTYPLKEYMQSGLKVTLNTDNCGISQTSVSSEFMKAAQLVNGLSQWDALVLIRNSLSIAFADSGTKLQLLRDFEDKIFELTAEYSIT
ncbi:MAG: hypothetical protein LBH00_08650 [Planctomycetaceae bacterium]|jgi:adenosine deaminase|nr:hypothetical protein [Planctomycetaceae bacterium]